MAQQLPRKVPPYPMEYENATDISLIVPPQPADLECVRWFVIDAGGAADESLKNVLKLAMSALSFEPQNWNDGSRDPRISVEIQRDEPGWDVGLSFLGTEWHLTFGEENPEYLRPWVKEITIPISWTFRDDTWDFLFWIQGPGSDYFIYPGGHRITFGPFKWLSEGFDFQVLTQFKAPRPLSADDNQGYEQKFRFDAPVVTYDTIYPQGDWSGPFPPNPRFDGFPGPAAPGDPAFGPAPFGDLNGEDD